MIKTIIFDFDGVLADSFGTFYQLLRDSMAHIGLELSPNQYRDLFIGNVHQSLKDLVNDEKRYLDMMEFRKSNYDKYYYDPKNKAELFSGAPEFLKKIDKRYTLAVASSGRQSNIENLLKESALRDLFSFILADSSFTKEGMIREILNRSDSKAEESVMVSDTVGDITVAKKVGLRTIAVTWGFHSIKTLESSKPDTIANNFDELFVAVDK